jgi:flagellar hook-basal body complex protein FliE
MFQALTSSEVIMSEAINSIGSAKAFSMPFPSPLALDQGAAGQGASFQDMLLSSINHVTSLDQKAQAAVESSLAGEDITQVEVMSAMKKADMTMRMLLQVRNKTLEAFNEIKQLRM